MGLNVRIGAYDYSCAEDFSIRQQGGTISSTELTAKLHGYNDKNSINLLNPSTWTVGTSGSQPGFSAQGTAPSTENIIELGIDPLGRSSPLWKMTADIAVPNSSDGGWETDYFDVSDSKTYRFVIYLKRTTTDGTSYLGLYSNLSNTVVTLAGGDNNNPYFWPGIPPLLNRWYVIIGYVHPKDTTITTSIGGVYDTVTGKKVFNGTDFKWKQGTTKAWHRAFYFYCDTAGSVQYFWGPRVEVCDGSEAPLEQLLSGVASDYQIVQMASDSIITPQEKIEAVS